VRQLPRPDGGGHPTPPVRCLIPALALPLRSKARFVCPQEHLDVLNALLPQVDRILAIGWKAGEPHFLNLLRAVPPGAKLVVVSRTLKTRLTVADRIAQMTSVVAGDSDTSRHDFAYTEFLRSGLESFLAT
jgi:hypothetical protein